MDLNTLKELKFMFNLYSDHSTNCLGYIRIVELIDEAESKIMVDEAKCKRIYFRNLIIEDEFYIIGKGIILILNIQNRPFNGILRLKIGDVIRDYKGKDYEITSIEQYKKLFNNLKGDNVALIVKEFNDKNESNE